VSFKKSGFALLPDSHRFPGYHGYQVRLPARPRALKPLPPPRVHSHIPHPHPPSHTSGGICPRGPPDSTQIPPKIQAPHTHPVKKSRMSFSSLPLAPQGNYPEAGQLPLGGLRLNAKEKDMQLFLTSVFVICGLWVLGAVVWCLFWWILWDISPHWWGRLEHELWWIRIRWKYRKYIRGPWW